MYIYRLIKKRHRLLPTWLIMYILKSIDFKMRNLEMWGTNTLNSLNRSLNGTTMANLCLGLFITASDSLFELFVLFNTNTVTILVKTPNKTNKIYKKLIEADDLAFLGSILVIKKRTFYSFVRDLCETD
jgi:hypothetical protein